MTDLPRSRWTSALAACACAEIVALGNDLAAVHKVVQRRVPQAGLTLLCLRDGVYDEPYHLGEIPNAVAHVEIELEDGRRCAGGAQVMHDSPELAVALAVCDAVLAHRLPGWEHVVRLIDSGEARRIGESRHRAALLASTHAEFTALDSHGASDD